MKIEVLPLSKARIFKCDKPWAAISVVTFKGDLPKLSEENRVGLIQLLFRDTDLIRQENAFNDTQAGQILDFVDSMFGKAEVLLIHCEAGLSRSPAIAAAISKIYAGDDKYWFKHKTPNMHVYRTILNECLKRYPDLAEKLGKFSEIKPNPNFTTLL